MDTSSSSLISSSSPIPISSRAVARSPLRVRVISQSSLLLNLLGANALYLTLTGRTDKPSQLVGSVDPWIFYPSIGLSAVVTDLISEDLRAKLRPTLSYLKVRTSYTEVGSPIPFTGLTPGTITHSMSSGKVEPFDYYPLPDLKAERTRLSSSGSTPVGSVVL